MKIPLDTKPMVWSFDWQTPSGEKKPVDIIMSLTSVDDGAWTGEVRVTGHPAPVSTFPVLGCDWIQAHQMMLQQVRFFSEMEARRRGKLFWRGTELELVVPEWRRHRPSLRDRLRAWWALRRISATA